MTEILREAINSEPIFKYTIIVLKFLFKITFKVVIFVVFFFIFLFLGSLFGGSTREKSQDEKDAEWLKNCALQQEWERNH